MLGAMFFMVVGAFALGVAAGMKLQRWAVSQEDDEDDGPEDPDEEDLPEPELELVEVRRVA